MCMKRFLPLLFILGTHYCSVAQDYIYYFEGTLNQQEISSIETELASIIGVASAKVKMKDETNHGEIFIALLPRPERSEKETLFSPVDVKKLLLNHQLTPIQFIESK